MAQEVPFHNVAEDLPNPEAPQGHAANGGNGGLPRLNWTSIMSSRMLQKFSLIVAEGIRPEKGFRYIHYNGIAKDLSALMGFHVDPSQVQNHLRKWRTKWLKICKLKNLNGAGWDEDKSMITMDDELCTGHLKDHPKDDEFLNVPLPNYHFLKTIFGSGLSEEEKAGKRKEGPPIQEEEQEGKRKKEQSEEELLIS